MGILRDISKKTMTEEKRKQSKNDIFAFYIGRPISYVLSVPFIKLKVKPNIITFISFFPSIIGFILVGFGPLLWQKILGWFFFFLWNLLDGVDGNVARYNEDYSKTGSLWDATSGYIAMCLMFFSVGIGCYFGNQIIFNNIDKVYYIIIGGLTSTLTIFPRLIMHKRISSIGKDEYTNEVKDRNSYSILKVIGLNLTSVAGFSQVLMLLSIIFKFMDLYTIFYFVIFLGVCVLSVKKLLK